MMRSTRNGMLPAVLAGAGFVISSLASPPVMSKGSIMVRDFVLSRGIQDREPVSATDSFHVRDRKAFAFAQIQNTGGPTVVSFVWEYGRQHYATIPVRIGASPGWRTWSNATLRSGNWRVKLLDADGEVLSVKAFTVQTTETGDAALPKLRIQGETGVPAVNPRPNGIPAAFDFLRR